MRLNLSSAWSSTLKFALVASSVWAMTACSETAATGEPVPIPAVALLCSSSSSTACAVNSTGPIIGAVFTTSGCSAQDFGETIRFTTQSYNCSSTSGCNVNIPTSGWTDKNGSPTSTIPSGTYSICGCMDLDRSSPPFENCDVYSELNNVVVNAGTIRQTLTTWDN